MLSKSYYLSTYSDNNIIKFVIDNGFLKYLDKKNHEYYITLASPYFKDQFDNVSESLKKLLFLKNISCYQSLTTITSSVVLSLKNSEELEKAMEVIFIFLKDKTIYFVEKECKTHKEMLEEIEKYIAKD